MRTIDRQNLMTRLRLTAFTRQLSCLAGVSALLSGCTSPEQRVGREEFSKRPALIAQLLKTGRIDQSRHDRLMADWKAHEERLRAMQAQQEAAAREREQFLASLTPDQRADFLLRERALEQQRQQFNAMLAQRQAEEAARAQAEAFERIQAPFREQQREINANMRNAADNMSRVMQQTTPQRIDVNIR
jgi:hypothetical protein